MCGTMRTNCVSAKKNYDEFNRRIYFYNYSQFNIIEDLLPNIASWITKLTTNYF